MKALTVRQPHAQLIALGVKTIETRTKPTKYRGPLLIHAGKAAPNYEGLALGISSTFKLDGSEDTSCIWLHSDRNKTIPLPLPLGAIVASCKLVDCVPVVELGEEPGIRRIEVGTWGPEPNLMLCASDAECETCDDISGDCDCDPAKWYEKDVTDQLPYGDFTPGRFAWLLEDIKPVEQRCPACWDRAIKSPNGKSYYADCLVCDNGVCQPVPAKGKQGLWEWTP